MHTPQFIQPLGDSSLTTQAAAVDDQCFDPFARGIECRGQPRRPAADDHEIVERAVGATPEAELRRQFRVGGLDQGRAIGKENGRNDALPVVDLLDDAQRFVVLVDIDEVVGHAMLPEELLRPLAVLAPRGAIHLDLALSHSLSLCSIKTSPCTNLVAPVTCQAIRESVLGRNRR